MQGMNGIGSGSMYPDFSKFGIKGRNNTASQKTKKQDDAKGVTAAPELSKAAQSLLDRIKDKYSDMDVFVADFQTDEEAQNIMSRSTSAYSLLISPDELEKMAADSKYADEKLGAIDDALEMGKKIDEEYGLDKALEKEGDSTVVKSFGISINSDGTTSMFAELEQVTQKQKEHIKAAREKRAKEQAEQDKRAEKEEEEKKLEEKFSASKRRNEFATLQGMKKTTSVWANSFEELIGKIQDVNFDKVKSELSASRVDYSV